MRLTVPLQCVSRDVTQENYMTISRQLQRILRSDVYLFLLSFLYTDNHIDVFLTIIMCMCTLIDMVFNTHILHLAVCVPSKQCWGVTYSSNSVCVLNGSSVDISCTYKCPRDHRINTTFWFNKQKSSQLPVDLNLGEDYQNHTEYDGKSENSCTLRLKDMRESHS